MNTSCVHILHIFPARILNLEQNLHTPNVAIAYQNRNLNPLQIVLLLCTSTIMYIKGIESDVETMQSTTELQQGIMKRNTFYHQGYRN